MHRSFSYDKNKRKSHKTPNSPRPDYPGLGIPARDNSNNNNIVSELEGSSPQPLYHDEAALIDDKYDASYFNFTASGMTKPAGAQELHDRAYVRLQEDSQQASGGVRKSTQAMARNLWQKIDIHN